MSRMSLYDEDRLIDARMEDYDDAHLADTTCGECGEEYYGHWTSGTRIDPPEPLNTCPQCGA